MWCGIARYPSEGSYAEEKVSDASLSHCCPGKLGRAGVRGGAGTSQVPYFADQVIGPSTEFQSRSAKVPESLTAIHGLYPCNLSSCLRMKCSLAPLSQLGV